MTQVVRTLIREVHPPAWPSHVASHTPSTQTPHVAPHSPPMWLRMAMEAIEVCRPAPTDLPHAPLQGYPNGEFDPNAFSAHSPKRFAGVESALHAFSIHETQEIIGDDHMLTALGYAWMEAMRVAELRCPLLIALSPPLIHHGQE